MPAVRFPPAVDRFDVAVEEVVERWRGHPVLDRVFYVASEVGNHSLIWHFLGATLGLRKGDHRLLEAVRSSAVIGVEAAIVNGPVKMVVRRERPVFEGERPHTLRSPRTSSFPSGHASAAFCAAGLLTDGDPHLAPVWYGLAAVVASSRVYTKVHHPSDVVAGAVVGAAFAAAAKRIWPRPSR